MNAVNFEYSLQNTLTSSKHSYLKSLMNKIENFLRRIKEKTHFYENSADDDSDQNNKNYVCKY